MNGALSLPAQDQAAGTGHIVGIIFNGIACFNDLARPLCGNFPFKHALHRVSAIDEDGLLHEENYTWIIHAV